jgi:hypothetical protein
MICFDALVFHRRHAAGENKFDTFEDETFAITATLRGRDIRCYIRSRIIMGAIMKDEITRNAERTVIVILARGDGSERNMIFRLRRNYGKKLRQLTTVERIRIVNR